MITNAERRFIEQWRDQKSGPKWKYYLLFSFGWTVISFLVIFFLLKLFTNLWETGGPNFIYIMIGMAIIIGVFLTHFTYVQMKKNTMPFWKGEKIRSTNFCFYFFLFETISFIIFSACSLEFSIKSRCVFIPPQITPAR